MRRVYFLMVVVFGMAAAAFGQATSSDAQTMRALLIEVRELRHELQSSLIKIQSAQILLSRLQIQEVAVTRASQHLDDARSKLAEVQLVMKSEAAKIKQFEDAAQNAGDDAAQVEEALKRAKADLETSTNLEQQRLSTESEAEEQLRTEQDKLDSLEAQLDELVRNMGDPGGQSEVVPR
jgi:DNA repair exonuclease SbcCD ATPase subunit